MLSLKKNKNQAVFFDRDGVLNRVSVKDGKPWSPRKVSNFCLFEGVSGAVQSIKDLNLLSIVVTNQPDIARGLLDIQELNRMHELLRELVPIDDIFVCIHDDIDKCWCRKPKMGLLLEAAEKWSIDLERSYLVGDTWRDIEVGTKAGCQTILIDRVYNSGLESNFRVVTLEEVVRVVRDVGLTKEVE